MTDLAFLLLALGLFAVSAAYVTACELLTGTGDTPQVDPVPAPPDRPAATDQGDRDR